MDSPSFFFFWSRFLIVIVNVVTVTLYNTIPAFTFRGTRNEKRHYIGTAIGIGGDTKSSADKNEKTRQNEKKCIWYCTRGRRKYVIVHSIQTPLGEGYGWMLYCTACRIPLCCPTPYYPPLTSAIYDGSHPSLSPSSRGPTLPGTAAPHPPFGTSGITVANTVRCADVACCCSCCCCVCCIVIVVVGRMRGCRRC